MLDQPKWLERAWSELGQREVHGAGHNPHIVDLFRDIGHDTAAHDEIAWCAAFVGACLERAGEASTRSLMARSYLAWGTPIEVARLGAIAVLSRGDNPALGHVGFVIGTTADAVLLLGGNQSDRVSVEAFEQTRVLGLRWPGGAGDRADPAAEENEELFERALAHVLAMEGGYTNDPYDPGGATNKGITLAVFAREKGVVIDPANKAALVEELKRIPDELVRTIYRERYWRPSQAAGLAPGLALMHFDASVNHGVGTAARLLQTAVGAGVDGEIGPQTRAAIRRTPTAEAIAAYAAVRRQRYRALPHFWRFGRGWLNRVARTEALALAWLRAERDHNSTPEQKGETDMTDTNDVTDQATHAEAKWWGQSMTIWGALVTALSTVLPAIGPLFGLNLTAELIHQLGEHIVQIVQALGGLIGIVMTVYGRFRADQPLERKVVSMRL